MRAKRTDANHTQVIGWLEQLGFIVHDTSGVGGGFPDLTVSYAGRTVLVEVKDGEKCDSQTMLRATQVAFRGKWKSKVWIVKDFDDVMKLMNWIAGVLEKKMRG